MCLYAVVDFTTHVLFDEIEKVLDLVEVLPLTDFNIEQLRNHAPQFVMNIRVVTSDGCGTERLMMLQAMQ